MAIAYDATSNGGITSYGTTNTFSHTCTGSDLILIVVSGNAFTDTTSITYNGTALTRIDNNTVNGTNTVWFLANPATGAHNIVISRSTDGTSNSIPLLGQAISYTGCDPTQPASMTFEGATTTSPKTVNTIVPNSNCWLIGSGWGSSNGDNLITTNRTSRQTQKFTFVTVAHKAMILADSNGTVSSGSQGVTFTESGTLDQFDCLTFSIYRKGDAVVAPTVTTQDATSVTKNSFTGNGNITATGGANATRQGVCYKVGTTGDPTTADSVAYTDGSFGTGAFTQAVTGLAPATGYRVAAYATNSAGTSYGSTVQVTTLADAQAGFLLRMI